ncbi:MAG: C4-type zinc ribbon domain-containing protein [Verrucomicrobia bacterium]|nr:C4-type zinc ribbon domain-containing protein [Verrucomicrobiota bacterium]
MPHAVLTQLLVVQDRDSRRRQLEQQLAAVPVERAQVNQSIATEKGAIETARLELMGLESKKKLLQTEIGSAETKLAKYRTQQLSVKKNDEYHALGKEIDTMVAAIGALEEQEIGVMFQIDEAKVRFETAEGVLKGNISRYEAKLATLVEREKNLSAELVEAKAAAGESRSGVPELPLRVYERVAARQWPVVVPLRGGKCGGCHLKVSSEAESGSRSADPAKLGICDQCGRILYWDYA